jgi:hypothetical protein
MLSPAEVLPTAWVQALMNLTTGLATVAATCQPAPGRHQHQCGAAQHAGVVGVRDAHAVWRLEVTGDPKPIEAEYLCQSTTALSHPMPSCWLASNRGHTRNDAGALGQRFLKPTARHAACSARSGRRLTARGAPGSRRNPLTKRRKPTQSRAESPPPFRPKSAYKKPFVRVANAADLVKIGEGQRQIIKLHGDFDDDASIVLSETSYFERLGFETPLDIELRADVLGHSVLFIGYSISDINIRLLFYKLTKMWATQKLASARPQSYMFSNRPNPVAETVLGQWGIKMVFGDEDDPKVALTQFLKELLT